MLISGNYPQYNIGQIKPLQQKVARSGKDTCEFSCVKKELSFGSKLNLRNIFTFSKKSKPLSGIQELTIIKPAPIVSNLETLKLPIDEIKQLFNKYEVKFGKITSPEVKEAYKKMAQKIEPLIFNHLENSGKNTALLSKLEKINPSKVNDLKWYKGDVYNDESKKIIKEGFQDRKSTWGSWFAQKYSDACMYADNSDTEKGIVYTVKTNTTNPVTCDSFENVRLSLHDDIKRCLQDNDIDFTNAEQYGPEKELKTQIHSLIFDKILFNKAKVDAFVLGSIDLKDATLNVLDKQSSMELLGHNLI